MTCLTAKNASATRLCAALCQGAASGTELQPLLQHRFSPHDVVALRPAKGDASAPVVASGVVYRLREAAVVIAVDEAPDDGLDQPLRLEKLANTVRISVFVVSTWSNGSLSRLSRICMAPVSILCSCAMLQHRATHAQ